MIQRVTEASVSVDGEVVGRCGRGVLVLVGVADGDDENVAQRLAAKIAALRIFPNAEGKFDRSLVDVGGDALVVSQFTLLADTAKGSRPSFTRAAAPERAERLVQHVVVALRGAGVAVETGRFAAQMAVALVNDGPVTIVLDVTPR